MAYYDFLNIIFSPLLKLPVSLAVIFLSFIISVIIIVITKYTTDQESMKKLREDMKEYQKQAKEARHIPSKALEIQKKSMQLQLDYFKHSFKATIFTFIPILFIFPWIGANFAYESIKPQQDFTVTAIFESANGEVEIIIPEGITLIDDKIKKIENGKATWTLKGNEGEYILEFVYNDEKQQKSVLITNDKKYIEQLKKTNGAIKSMQINYKKLIVLPIGIKDWFGWLGTYIWSSIIFTMGLRKMIKVY